jgi:hypothetical protein
MIRIVSVFIKLVVRDVVAGIKYLVLGRVSATHAAVLGASVNPDACLMRAFTGDPVVDVGRLNDDLTLMALQLGPPVEAALGFASSAHDWDSLALVFTQSPLSVTLNGEPSRSKSTTRLICFSVAFG